MTHLCYFINSVGFLFVPSFTDSYMVFQASVNIEQAMYSMCIAWGSSPA